MPRRSQSSSTSARRPSPINTGAPRRNASTSSAPQTTHQSQIPQQTIIQPALQQQGIMSQIMTTAAGVATGHVVGRMVSGLFGSSGSPTPNTSSEASLSPNHNSNGAMSDAVLKCDHYKQLLNRCLEENSDSISTCQDYMAMLKTCQSSS